MELKVFTLPTCSGCPMAKMIALEVAQKYGVACRVVDMTTKEGLVGWVGLNFNHTNPNPNIYAYSRSFSHIRTRVQNSHACAVIDS
jgi:hypothetical protein